MKRTPFDKPISEDILNVVNQEEHAYLKSVKEAARLTLEGGYRFLFLAGPSCSGKTTTGHLLTKELEKAGKRVFAFSTDDFFRDKIFAPKNEDGSPNFDAFEHSDPEEMKKVLRHLAVGEKTEIPIFDFQTGNRSKNTTKVNPEKWDLFILEGIHALNDSIVDSIKELSPPICFYLDVTNSIEGGDPSSRLLPHEIRFCRRLIRDAKHRNACAEWTFTLWESVIRSEKEILHPFRKNAARIINTGLSYEIGVEKREADALLQTVSADSPFRKRAEEMRRKLAFYPSLPNDIVPHQSVLREFID